MNKSFTSTQRPTFKRVLWRIGMLSVSVNVTLIWLFLCVSSVVTLKQYAQKNLELTGATMSHSLEASLILNDSQAANEALTLLGDEGHFAVAEVINVHNERFAYWSKSPDNNNDALGALISNWLFPVPVSQPIMHNGTIIGEIRLTINDSLISNFIRLSFAILTGSVLFATLIALTIIQSLHHGIVTALQNITEVLHDVRTNRNFSRRVKAGLVEEIHKVGEDFNFLLDEMEEWQLKLQTKNTKLLHAAMHDPLTGLANRAAFHNSIAALMNAPHLRANSALLFLDGDNFKVINDTWGHAAGDAVLLGVASRMVEFGDKRYQSYRLGGDEFAMVLHDVHSESEVQDICDALSQQFMRPFDLPNGLQTSMSLSIGFALAWENASEEALLSKADRNMYHAKISKRKARQARRPVYVSRPPSSAQPMPVRVTESASSTSHHVAGEEGDNHSQIQPALPDQDISDAVPRPD